MEFIYYLGIPSNYFWKISFALVGDVLRENLDDIFESFFGKYLEEPAEEFLKETWKNLSRYVLINF